MAGAGGESGWGRTRPLSKLWSGWHPKRARGFPMCMLMDAVSIVHNNL